MITATNPRGKWGTVIIIVNPENHTRISDLLFISKRFTGGGNLMFKRNHSFELDYRRREINLSRTLEGLCDP